MNRTFYFLVLLLCSAVVAKGQQFSIASGSGVSCAGVIEDSGGPSEEYSNGENFTFTICPDVPGNVIYLTWFVFNLSTQGPNADNLTIYDGDNTSALSLGTYTGSALQNLVVSGTVFNTSGCLTLVFQSNASGTGDFAAGFQCTIPCENPMSVATMTEAVPALICQGETVDFDGSASFAQGDYTIAQYLWDFDDGTVDSTSGPITSHTFQEDGEYMVQLFVTDDNGCGNLNLVDLQILVSTTPNFSETDPSVTACLGETVTLFGHAEPVTWTGIPDANFGEGIFLPDDVGLPFTSSLVFEQFNSGQIVNSASDIESICVEMEHTFMGDLVLQVICPNGQTVILHQQGGNGTYLGAPNDYDSNEEPIFGECWEYCWSPTAMNGTWIENTGNTTVAGTPPSASLNPGTYESVQPISNLIGCPLNGEWIYQSTDLWGADNGFICSWSINFNPAIIPDVTQFTPIIGPGADSSLWTGGTIPDELSANGDTVTFTATAPGDYPFIYQVTDDFGCTYDTTITVTVTEPYVVDAGPDMMICNDALQLQATVNGPPSSSGITWEWTPPDGLSDTDIPNPTVIVTSSTTFYASAYPTDHPECAAMDSVTITLDPELDPGLDSLIVVCATPPAFQLIDMLNGTPQAGGVWTNSSGQVVPDTFDPVVDAAGVYTYTLTTTSGCIGTADLEIEILPATDPNCCGVVDAGLDTILCELTHTLTASIGNTFVGHWSGPPGYVFAYEYSAETMVTAPASGAATFYWIENDGVFCDLIDSVTVVFTEPLAATFETTDAICYDACDGLASVVVTGGNGAFEYSWNDNVSDSPNAEDLCAGDHSLYVEDENGCNMSTGFIIGQPPLLQMDSIRFVSPWCNGNCDGSITIYDAEAIEYSFNDGASYTNAPTLSDLCAGSYELTIRDAQGCIGTGHIVVTEPPAVVADFLHAPIPANVDAPTVYFYDRSENAVSWSWDIAGLLSTTAQNPIFTFDNREPGFYDVCLIAFDGHACSDTICRTVEIEDVLFTYVPNAFTPDGDGLNETWGMSSNIDDIQNFTVQVFDRWGKVIFESNEPHLYWDGTLRNGGNMLKQDVYPYRIVFRQVSTGEEHELMGHVTLVR